MFIKEIKQINKTLRERIKDQQRLHNDSGKLDMAHTR